MKKFLNERNQIHNFISSSGSGTGIKYSFGSDFLTSYVSVPLVKKYRFLLVPKFPVPSFPVPVSQDWMPTWTWWRKSRARCQGNLTWTWRRLAVFDFLSTDSHPGRKQIQYTVLETKSHAYNGKNGTESDIYAKIRSHNYIYAFTQQNNGAGTVIRTPGVWQIIMLLNILGFNYLKKLWNFFKRDWCESASTGKASSVCGYNSNAVFRI